MGSSVWWGSCYCCYCQSSQLAEVYLAVDVSIPTPVPAIHCCCLCGVIGYVTTVCTAPGIVAAVAAAWAFVQVDTLPVPRYWRVAMVGLAKLQSVAAALVWS